VEFRVSERSPRDLKSFQPAWEPDESDLDPLPDCTCQTHLALGDAARICSPTPVYAGSILAIQVPDRFRGELVLVRSVLPRGRDAPPNKDR